MSLFNHSHQLNLPVHPLILLPDGWLCSHDNNGQQTNAEITLDLIDNHCFSAALHFAINNPIPPMVGSPHRPRAVSWMNLEISPFLKDDVVGAVFPIVGWKRAEILRLDSNRGTGDDDDPCNIEMHHCMRSWKFHELLNLRVVIALPWPDLIPHHGKWVQKEDENIYMDLSNFSMKGIQVTVLPNIFEEQTREVLITMVIVMLSGFLGEHFEISKNTLVKKSLPPSSKPPPTKLPSKSSRPPRRVCPTAGTPLHQLITSKTASPSNTTFTTKYADHLLSSRVFGAQFMTMNSWQEATVGFLGLLTESAKKTAKLFKEGFGISVLYHQKRPLPELKEIRFVAELPEFLSSCDVVILMDAYSDRQMTLSKYHRARTPLRQKITKRSRFAIQEDDFRHFKPTALFVSTSTVENFSFTALAEALRNQKISGAAFTIPLDGCLSPNELQALQHLRNVLSIAPPSTPRCTPNKLRRKLAGMVLQELFEGLGLPFFIPKEMEPLKHDDFADLKTPMPSKKTTTSRRSRGFSIAARIKEHRLDRSKSVTLF
ncbi:unnamed protein product [Rodentolepis nana]|uniref:BK_channel_a domain-containing protein n=1 Tax=Rodentolepis nana TaxID=102285 RepID=A0A0R3T3V7_RODNA|nr:unnamed protein product [Rodentolepis nana]